MEPVRDERTIRDLLSELIGEVTTLVKKELDLARAEASEKASQLGTGFVSLAAGLLFAFAGLLILLNAIVIELSDGAADLDPAVAALIVGGVTALLGVVFLIMGRNNLRARNLTPERTAESLRQSRELVEQRLR